MNERKVTENRKDGELLQLLIDRLDVQDWELLLVGDGSGNGWSTANGWACTLIDRRNRGPRLFYGGMNCGSNNLAEVMPYLQAMLWYDAHRKSFGFKPAILHVVVVSDSEVTVRNGTAATDVNQPLPHHCAPLWAAFRSFVRSGYRFTFRWSRRESSDLNRLADAIAGLSRRTIVATPPLTQEQSDRLALRAALAIEQMTFVPPSGLSDDLYLINPLPDG